ncbi:LysM peptidoglycan-binding domain-containing protein [Klebsiella quasipneumoniae]|uniref:LysM peptidoglycan-binding domain-containing protein n=1 Tax=Klebsiella quasipneumoniae TaxID=1463165 RepID=UPI0023B0FDA9|nr:LysM domain-containing protein [Klebsiella quasipneumoniae]
MELVNQKVYIVKSGDTLFGIANHFCHNAVLRFKIADDNHIADTNLIYQGQRIWIREEFLKEEFRHGVKEEIPAPSIRSGGLIKITESLIVERFDGVNVTEADFCSAKTREIGILDSFFYVVSTKEELDRVPGMVVVNNKGSYFFLVLDDVGRVVSFYPAERLNLGFTVSVEGSLRVLKTLP